MSLASISGHGFQDAHEDFQKTNSTGGKSFLTDYIPAARASSGRIENKLSTEASAHLQDADLAPKMSGRFNVFGNAAFEAEAPGNSFTANTEPGAVQMNNLVGVRGSRLRSVQLDRVRSQGVDSSRSLPASTSASTSGAPMEPDKRLNSITKIFRKSNIIPKPDEDLDSGTMVRAFDDNEAELRERQQEPISTAPPPAIEQSLTVGRPHEQSMDAWEAQVRHMLSRNQRDDAFQMAAPSSGLVRCCIKRVKQFLGGCTFQMYLEAGSVFLMAARKRKKSKVSAYVMSQDLGDLKRDTENCLSKLKANFVGTEYMLWGQSEDNSVRKGYAAEQLCINFKHTVLTSSGPRTMYVVLPMPDSGWQPSAVDGSDSLSNALELARHRELPPSLERKMAMLCTKAPDYDDAVKGYTLDFQGRVKEASVKNFQLVAWDHNTDQQGSNLIMQFGKVDNDTYALDFTYPMSIKTAFAVALASIDTKLCYTL